MQVLYHYSESKELVLYGEEEIVNKLVIYGAGYWGVQALSYYGEENIYCFCDSKVKGKVKGKKVISFQNLVDIYKGRDIIVLVCVGVNYTEEVCNQLEVFGIDDYLVQDLLTHIIDNGSNFIEQIKEEIKKEKLYRRYYKYVASRNKKQLEYLKNHVDIKTLTPAKGKLRERQLYQIKFVQEFWEFVSELDIKAFLTFGNLVGAYRHQGFIPWDDDMDFGMMRHEYMRLLDFAKKNCLVGTRCNGIWVDECGKEENMTLDQLIKKYPNKYIFDIRSDMVQVFKGTYKWFAPRIDIWIYDFYKEGYNISVHKKWIQSIEEKLNILDCEKEKVELIRKEYLKNSMISMEEAKYFYPGIDNFGGYPGLKSVDSWILTEDIFPLKKAKYENVNFFVPNKMEELLKHLYPSYTDFPYDLGVPHHGNIDGDIINEEE